MRYRYGLNRIRDVACSKCGEGTVPDPHAAGALLRSLREARGLDQEQAADRCSIARARLSRIERGEIGLSWQSLAELRDALEQAMTQ